MANADGKIPDGITAEVVLSLNPVPAVQIPRSALTISAAGDIGVRVVGEGDKVAFVPVHIVEDLQDTMWVSGVQGRRARHRARAGFRPRRPGRRRGRGRAGTRVALMIDSGRVPQRVHPPHETGACPGLALKFASRASPTCGGEGLGVGGSLRFTTAPSRAPSPTGGRER